MDAETKVAEAREWLKNAQPPADVLADAQQAADREGVPMRLYISRFWRRWGFATADGVYQDALGLGDVAHAGDLVTPGATAPQEGP